VGEVGGGWRVANATLSGERQMVSGSGSGGVDRIGGSGVEHIVGSARALGRWDDGGVRQRLAGLLSEERIRAWTNRRVRDNVKTGRSPGPESSIGKVHQGSLNQRLQMAAVDLLGPGGQAWLGPGGQAWLGPDGQAWLGPDGQAWPHDPVYQDGIPYEVGGMLRSRANTIEGGTTEVNKNILAERVLGLPREPDPWKDLPWNETPRS
jgi:alkylation response protein AidB-like acyl-CoA dehydrogenase